VAVRLTVLQQIAKGSPDETRDEEEDYPLRDPVVREWERLTWVLWHGDVYKAVQVMPSVEMDLEAAVANTGDGTARQRDKVVEEFHTDIEHHKGFIPTDGERYRAGERISTDFVESPVNHQVISKRCCEKQQRQWTKRGTHLLLHTRVNTLNQELGAMFQRWYPDMQLEEEPQAA
jgi:hypothetical protein